MACDLLFLALGWAGRFSWRRGRVGKTEIAKVLAETLGRKLIRLQCYEGLIVSAAVYEWNYAAQMIAIRLGKPKAIPSASGWSMTCSPSAT